MKKKLALLLVLAMMFSALPMSVFGATYISPISQSVTQAGYWQKTTVWIDVSEFLNPLNTTTGSAIDPITGLMSDRNGSA